MNKGTILEIRQEIKNRLLMRSIVEPCEFNNFGCTKGIVKYKLNQGNAIPIKWDQAIKKSTKEYVYFFTEECKACGKYNHFVKYLNKEAEPLKNKNVFVIDRLYFDDSKLYLYTCNENDKKEIWLNLLFLEEDELYLQANLYDLKK